MSLITLRITLALTLLCCLGAVQAIPSLDHGFGNHGVTRIGKPSGNEDWVYASAIQPDGKVIVGGLTAGRTPAGFVARFTADGAPDPTFGNGGRVILPAAPSLIGLELQPDGALIIVHMTSSGLMLSRLTASGTVDTTFGSDGSATVADSTTVRSSAVRVAIQPDGKLLVVFDATIGSQFGLKLRRLLPDGSVDSAFGSNGERVIANLPSNFSFASPRLAVADPGGGFTLAAWGRNPASGNYTTYLVARITAEGGLDSSFGGAGYVSGFDMGNPGDSPRELARDRDGRTLLIGDTTSGGSTQLRDVLWAIGPQGQRVAFATGGRLVLDTWGNNGRSVVGMADGDIAVAQDTGDRFIVYRFDSSGNRRPAFGNNGSLDLHAPGYLNGGVVGIVSDASQRLTIVASGFVRTIVSAGGIVVGTAGRDVLLGGITSSGRVRTDFGRGDGFAILDIPTFSSDTIDTLRFDGRGRIIAAGTSSGLDPFDFVLTRLDPNGLIDRSYGVDGRANGKIQAHFTGLVRAALQPDGSVVVASGSAIGSAGQFPSFVALRFDPDGKLDTTFKPALVIGGANASPAIATRPDGRIVDVGEAGPTSTNPAPTIVVQQLLPTGDPDPGFGTNGRVSIPSRYVGGSRLADLVVLPDGSLAFALFGSTARVGRTDASGNPVVSFGDQGVQELAVPAGYGFTSVGAPTLLALGNGDFVAAYNVSKIVGSNIQQALLLLRLSSDGRIISGRLVDEATDVRMWALAALPDASIVIARTHRNDIASLQRLLPNDQLDAGFGSGSTYVLKEFTSVSSVAADADGKLVVAGQDAASALIGRYDLAQAISSVPIVEFYNTLIGHYFVTANAQEMATIDAGGAGPGWRRTGLGFSAWVPEAGIPSDATPVCRFYGTPGRGPNSHFYTASAPECEAVKQDPGWGYEGIAFYALRPKNDQCPGSTPVWRAYNNRFAQNDSNHRYSTQRSQLEAMTGEGWSVEGVAFCATP